MCWFGESKTHTEFWRGNSVKVVVWKIDKEMGIMQMMIFGGGGGRKIMRKGGRWAGLGFVFDGGGGGGV